MDGKQALIIRLIIVIRKKQQKMMIHDALMQAHALARPRIREFDRVRAESLAHAHEKFRLD